MFRRNDFSFKKISEEKVAFQRSSLL